LWEAEISRLHHEGGNMAEAKKTAAKQPKKAVKVDKTLAQEDVQVDTKLEGAEASIQEQLVEPETQSETEDTKLAKAGKRSAKALKEEEEKNAKEARKATQSELEADAKPKLVVKPTRTRLERRGKLFRKSAEQLEKGKLYPIDQAVELAKKTSSVKFDATVEFHINLGVDPRLADQNIRDTLLLPSGTGKKVRIAVLTEDASEAKKAGADLAGTDELLAELEKGNLNFDILIATPALMVKLGKYARVLGPRGLMPSPKSGTVTTDVNRAIAEAKAGRVEYRVDSTGIIHLGVGKVSFSPQQLQDNIQAVLTSVKSNKPSSVKGIYLKSAYVSTTMGPSIGLELSSMA
jgi:large subunit ribosomal protein L1